MEIRKLERITICDINKFGLNGFRTHRVLQVKRNESDIYFDCSISEVELEKEYIKVWPLDDSTLNCYNEIISKGMSFGAYDSDELVGYILLSEMSWNKSLWIDYIMVADTYKGTGVGSKLINKALEIGNANYQVLGLEVQNENYGAIKFYQKLGFNIDGVEFSRYSEKENEKDVAFIMKYKFG